MNAHREQPEAEPAPERARRDAMLAHDLRCALNGVLGGLAVMERAALDPSLRRQLERVAASAELLTVLVADAGGAGGDGARDEAEWVHLDKFLEHVARRWTAEAQEKGIGLEIIRGARLPERLLVRFVDLSRIVGNLVSNAVKFSQRGTLRLDVRRSASGGVQLALLDDGPGLGSDSAAQLFEYGYRSPGVRQPGEGIGLHVAKTLAETLGGRLTIGNRTGGGLRAVLELPEALCVGSGDAPAAAEKPASLRGLRVLLAEDNPTNQMVARQMLAGLDAAVTTASDGIEAIERFGGGEFDLVVVDIEMPRASGLDVIEAIRTRGDQRAHVPVVALTACAMKEDREHIARAGADGLISKPIVSINAFGRALSEHVRQRRPDADPAAPLTATAEEECRMEPLVCPETYKGLASTVGESMMDELLDRVALDLGAAATSLSAARATSDRTAIRAASHILISVAGAFGAGRLQRLAERLNAAANEATDTDGPELLDACLEEIDAVLRFVRGRRTPC